LFFCRAGFQPAAAFQAAPRCAGIPLTDTLISTENSSASGSGASSEFSFYRQDSDTKRLLIGPVFRLGLSNFGFVVSTQKR
jgi:hypothetical protein